jgi:hypothetical protein
LKKVYLLPIVFVVGFGLAFLATGVSSYFFVLLPVVAFASGYFFTWWWGLLNGFLLFLGYTFATAFVWFGISINLSYPLQYFYAFIVGGFSLILMGALAPIVRKSIRSIGSGIILIIFVFVIVWCSFQAMPTYNYFYQVTIHATENLDNLQLYLPAGVVVDDIYEELYESPVRDPMASLTREFDKELVDTEHGRMLKLTLSELMKGGPRGYPYTCNIIFVEPGFLLSGNRFAEVLFPWQRESAPHKLIRLTPRYNINPINTVKSRESLGPLKVKENKIIEEFTVPIMVISDINADFELRLENRTVWRGWINFTYSKSNTYTEHVRYEGHTGNEWQNVIVEVTQRLNTSGIGN